LVRDADFLRGRCSGSFEIRSPETATESSVLAVKESNIMSSKLYVGNLSFDTTEVDLQDTFAEAGTVSEVALMQDKFTGKSRGFGFVTMSSADEGQKAISLFHGKNFQGRPLTVNEARPREDRAGGGGGGGRSYGGGGGGGGDRGGARRY
jgi:RNA recognition motif-containing protein